MSTEIARQHHGYPARGVSYHGPAHEPLSERHPYEFVALPGAELNRARLVSPAHGARANEERTDPKGGHEHAHRIDPARRPGCF